MHCGVHLILLSPWLWSLCVPLTLPVFISVRVFARAVPSIGSLWPQIFTSWLPLMVPSQSNHYFLRPTCPLNLLDPPPKSSLSCHSACILPSMCISYFSVLHLSPISSNWKERGFQGSKIVRLLIDCHVYSTEQIAWYRDCLLTE